MKPVHLDDDRPLQIVLRCCSNTNTRGDDSSSYFRVPDITFGGTTTVTLRSWLELSRISSKRLLSYQNHALQHTNHREMVSDESPLKDLLGALVGSKQTVLG